MGDRCSWSATFLRKEDAEIVAKELDISYDLDNGGYYFYDEEANYGNYPQMQEWAEKGMAFIARHGAGDDYEACDYVAWRGMLHESRDEGPVISLDGWSGLHPGQLDSAIAYIKAEHIVNKRLGNPTTPPNLEMLRELRRFVRAQNKRWKKSLVVKG